MQLLNLFENNGTIKGIIITLKGSDEFDFYSRYFAPWVGIPEDQVKVSIELYFCFNFRNVCLSMVIGNGIITYDFGSLLATDP